MRVDDETVLEAGMLCVPDALLSERCLRDGWIDQHNKQREWWLVFAFSNFDSVKVQDTKKNQARHFAAAVNIG